VKYEYLSNESMIEIHDIFLSSFDCLTPDIWSALRSRLILPVFPSPLERRYFCSSHPFREDSRFSGIIAYLTKKHGGNVHGRHIVILTSSSISGSAEYPLKNIVDLDTQFHFWTRDEINQWICWDFQNLRIIPSHYVIKSEGPGGSHLRTWVLEGSNDGCSWIELDHRTNDLTLNGSLAVGTFEIQKRNEVRMIRITSYHVSKSR
jgi:hypothetical protein